MEEQIGFYLAEHSIEYESNANMAERTWIRRGPIVPYMVFPQTAKELEDLIRYLVSKRVRFKLIGHTSNLYFQETFQTDVVISTRKMNTVIENDACLVCDAGANVSRLAKQCVEKGYKGFEGLVGLPGTVAAAIVNNSSCFGSCLADLVVRAEVIEINDDNTCSKKSFLQTDFHFSRRSSIIKRGEINVVILKVSLRIENSNDLEGLKQLSDSNIEKRRLTQEGKTLNLGSVFSAYKPRPITLFSLGFWKIVPVMIFRIRDHFRRDKQEYQLKRNHYLLRLYGFRDIEKYVSPKNINCFIWKDNGADNAFERYCLFMNRYADCGPLEIEILS